MVAFSLAQAILTFALLLSCSIDIFAHDITMAANNCPICASDDKFHISEAWVRAITAILPSNNG